VKYTKHQRGSGAHTTHHTQQKAILLLMTVVLVSHSLGLTRHVYSIHNLTSIGKLRTVLEEGLHHNSELCRTRPVLQLCSCGNQKQMNSPANLPPQNSVYITQPDRALTPLLWRHNTRKREVHSPYSQLKQQTQGVRAS